MNVGFQCPSCLRTLRYEGGETAFQICRFCKGKIIVPSDAVHQAEVVRKRPSEFTLIEQKNLKLAEIQRELQFGRKIEAIAMFRNTFGTDLRDAKQAVEALERGSRIDLSRSALKQNYEVAQEQTTQSVYPNAAGANQEQRRAAVVILAIVIAIAAGILFFLTEN